MSQEPSLMESIAIQSRLRDQRAQQLESALRNPDPASFERLMRLDEEELWAFARDYFILRRLEVGSLPRGSAEAGRRFSILCAHAGLQRRLSSERAPARRAGFDGIDADVEMSMFGSAVRILFQLQTRPEAKKAAGLALSAAFQNEHLKNQDRIDLCMRASGQEAWAGQVWSEAFGSALKRLAAQSSGDAIDLFEQLGRHTASQVDLLDELTAIGAPLAYETAIEACRKLSRVGQEGQNSGVRWVELARKMEGFSLEMARALAEDPFITGACKAALERVELEGAMPLADRKGGLSL